MQARRIICLVLIALVTAACSLSAGEALTPGTEVAAVHSPAETVSLPAANAMPQPTATAALNPTLTPMPADTATPTQEPAPTQIPTDAPITASLLGSLVFESDLPFRFFSDPRSPIADAAGVTYLFTDVIEQTQLLVFVNMLPTDSERVEWERHMADIQSSCVEFAFMFPDTWSVGESEVIPESNHVGDMSQGVRWHYFDSGDTDTQRAPVTILYQLEFRRNDAAVSIVYWEYVDDSASAGSIDSFLDIVELAQVVDNRLIGGN